MTGGPPVRRHDVVVTTGAFLPGFKAGGPVKSIAEMLERLPEDLTCLVLTADRDLGDPEPYPGLSGRTVPHGRHEVHYVDPRSPHHWREALRRVRGARPRLLYVNSFFSPFFTVLPVLAARVRLFHVADVLIAPRGELSPGALAIRSRKKRLFVVPWSLVLRSLRPTFHASTDDEARLVRELLPWARVVVQINSLGPEPREAPLDAGAVPRFVFLSRISRKKNLPLALAALAQVPERVDLDIYGPIEDPAVWDECTALLAALPQQVRVTYLGPLRPPDVAATLAQYDALVLPTLGENFGHVVAESLAAGCPVVCSTRTPWTGLLESGGGTAVGSFDVAHWSAVLSSWARTDPGGRTARKARALAAYRRWRAQAPARPAVETVLDRSRATRAPHRGDRPAQTYRVAVLTQGFRTAGGIQTSARWLRDELRRRGHEVDVFDLATSRSDERSRRIAAPRTWFDGPRIERDATEHDVWHVGASLSELEPFRYLPRRVLDDRLRSYDVLQVVAGGAALSLSTSGAGRPVAVQVATRMVWERKRAAAAHRWPASVARRAIGGVVDVMERRALARADAVLVLNAEMSTYARAHCRGEVVLAPPGVDTDRFRPRPGGRDPRSPILAVGRLADPRKGYDRVLHAYRTLCGLVPEPPPLVLAGRGDLPARERALVADLPRNGRVQVLSDVPEDQLPGLYRAASVFLQGSYEEGLGIAVLEAMASGLPVVATTTAGTRETVVPGRTGFLVEQGDRTSDDLADALVVALGPDGARLGAAGRERAVETFSTDAAIGRYLETYRRLTGRAR